jgi:hypothetical protein
VIENTVRVKLPEGFQRAEFLQTKGAVDFICDRRELRSTVANVLAMLQRQSADACPDASAAWKQGPMNVQIPLFPLGTVLFPGGILPLQIFEVRYLDMVRRCHREGTPFGVVCLTEGHEVQQAEARTGGFKPEGFHDVGTLAHIVALEQAQPGLLVMVCEGRERFQIQRSEKLKHGLWMADVDLLPEDSLTPCPRTAGHGPRLASTAPAAGGATTGGFGCAARFPPRASPLERRRLGGQPLGRIAAHAAN